MADNPTRSLLRSLPSSWQLIPLREFPHLYALKDQSGEVIATVHSEHAQEFQALPELLDASREILEKLRSQYSEWDNRAVWRSWTGRSPCFGRRRGRLS
jgi:hypothetical protein